MGMSTMCGVSHKTGFNRWVFLDFSVKARGDKNPVLNTLVICFAKDKSFLFNTFDFWWWGGGMREMDVLWGIWVFHKSFPLDYIQDYRQGKKHLK